MKVVAFGMIFFLFGCLNPAPDTEKNHPSFIIHIEKPGQPVMEKDHIPEWIGKTETAVWAWKNGEGRVFVFFKWSIRPATSGKDKLIGSSRQKWAAESSVGPLQVSIHPGTLSSKNTTAQKEAMFHTKKPVDIPHWVRLQYIVEGKTALDTVQDVIEIPTSGLSFELSKDSHFSFYNGRQNEASSKLLIVPFKAHNPTNSPIAFSPFEWTSEFGGQNWKYHNKTSFRSLKVIQPDEVISGTIALGAKPGSKEVTEAEIKYQESPVGNVLIKK